MRHRALAALVLAALGATCERAPERAGSVRAVATRLPKDTIRFTAPARAARCSVGTGGGLLLEGSSGGNGVLVWLRASGPLEGGSWPLLQRGDTVSRRGATVGLRFMGGDVAYGVALDSGTVTLTDDSGLITLVVSGAGISVAAAGRVDAEATFDAVPVGADTVSCRPAA